MFFDSQNIIDEKIVQTFPKEILENVNSEKLDCFGINISSDLDKDFAFKVYYSHKYSLELYSKAKKIPLIEFLSENKIMKFLTFVFDEKHMDCSRYDIGLARQTNEKMDLLFSYLKENCSFYEKYEKEILELSQMKVSNDEALKYPSLYFAALLDGGKTLKCHWHNRSCLRDIPALDNRYYFDFIENSNVEGLKKILPTAKRAIEIGSGYMWVEGIDYNEFGSQKHKIYIYGTKNTYETLIETYTGNKALEEKLKTIQEWHNIHSEFNCVGFALGEDSNNNSTINLYYRL